MSKLTPDLIKDWKIVIIDDEPDSLEVARYILDFYGANVYTAADGQEGIALVERIKPSLVISDLSMPQMDGWDFLEALKSKVSIQHIPVIALTAHAMKGDRERAIAAGFHNYLTKPLTANTFMDELLILLTDIPQIEQYITAHTKE
jgi:two-component system, cell cycle response regulator DivK